MWHVKKLSLIDFMSHRDTVLEIVQDQATMIYGINKTNKGQSSNGSGKSAVLEGIVIGVFGEPLRKVSTKVMVRRGGPTHANVILELHNDKLDHTVIITRTVFKNTKSSEVDITINGIAPQGLQRNGANKYDVREANKWILNQIGISKEDLLNYFLVSKKQYKSFFALGDVAKKEVIGRFSQSNQIEPVFEVIKSEIDHITSSKTLIEQKITANKTKIDVYQEQLDRFDLNALQINDKQAELTLQDNLLTLKEKTKPLEILIQTLNGTLDQLNLQLNTIPKVEGDSTKDEQTLKEYNAELAGFTTEANEVMNKLTEYENNLRGAINCPKCQHKFNPGKVDVDMEKQEELKAKAIKLVGEINVDVTAVKADIKKVGEAISVRDQKLAARRAIVRAKQLEIDDKTAEITRETRNLTNNKASIKSVEDQIAILKNKVITDPTADLEKSIRDHTNANMEHQGKIDALDIKLGDKKQWESHFIRFKTHLSNKTIGVMQAHCNEYLDRIGTDLSLNIEGYKVNRDKSIRENITTNVLRDGVDEGVLDAFSSGEEAKIIVSMILTQQKLINSSCANGGFGLCFLDEIIESVDTVGISGLMTALNSLGQTIVVITHGTFDQQYENTLSVVKKNGISEIS